MRKESSKSCCTGISRDFPPYLLEPQHILRSIILEVTEPQLGERSCPAGRIGGNNAEDCIRSACAQSSAVTKAIAALRIRFFVLNRVRPPPPMGIQSAPAFSTEGFPFETVALGRREAPKPWGGPTSEARGKRVTGQERRRGGGEKAIAATPSTAKRFSTKGIIRCPTSYACFFPPTG